MRESIILATKKNWTHKSHGYIEHDKSNNCVKVLFRPVNNSNYPNLHSLLLIEELKKILELKGYSFVPSNGLSRKGLRFTTRMHRLELLKGVRE